MKTILLLATLALAYGNLYSQENFRWEVTDSIEKPQAQIYSETKMFIAEKWKSAQSVIQNDDKDAGLILVKAIFVYYPKNSNQFTYTYAYSVKFMFKENRFRIILSDVFNESAHVKGLHGEINHIEPFEGDNAPKQERMKYFGLSKEKVILLRDNLKADLQSVVDSYIAFITKENSTGDW
jgi:hypothetical protein